MQDLRLPLLKLGPDQFIEAKLVRSTASSIVNDIRANLVFLKELGDLRRVMTWKSVTNQEIIRALGRSAPTRDKKLHQNLEISTISKGIIPMGVIEHNEKPNTFDRLECAHAQQKPPSLCADRQDY